MNDLLAYWETRKRKTTEGTTATSSNWTGEEKGWQNLQRKRKRQLGENLLVRGAGKSYTTRGGAQLCGSKPGFIRGGGIEILSGPTGLVRPRGGRTISP